MNRVDPHLEALAAPTLLSQADLSAWSAADFALAHSMVCAPVELVSGLCGTRLRLAPRFGLAEPAIASLPIQLPVDTGGHAVNLSLSSSALDGLVHLLDRSQPVGGAGATLSLDGMESLLAALLAPLTSVQLGRAKWVGSRAGSAPPLETGAAWRLEGEGFDLDVTGTTDAVASLAKLLAAHADPRVAAPLSYLRAARPERPAVSVEWMSGYTALPPDAARIMAPGGAVTLDALWPEPRAMVARRFVAGAGPGSHEKERWQVEAAAGPQTWFVRQAETICLLDQPDLIARPAQPGDGHDETSVAVMDLVGPGCVIAHGRLETLGKAGPVFLIERMADR